MIPPIRNVSDTALWVAMYRAMESERPDAVFHDPYARNLAGERGAEIVRAMPRGRAMAWPMIVRTAVMDEIILRLVGHGVRTVLNFAAGLDTRAYRLGLPPSLRWFDIDLPDIIRYREERLGNATPICLHEHVIADLADDVDRTLVLERAAPGDGPAMVITEGLLIYLTPAQVAAMASQIRAVPAVCWWLTDLGSPRLLRMLRRRWHPQLAAANAPMQFAPPEGTAFFTPLGWREAEFRSTWDESLRLKRSVPMAGLWNWLGRFQPPTKREEARRMSGIVLLERA
ncbi:MAG: class I SAM-dependent methyltransferase [Gemmatimonadales bacterium]|nr:class I SAM-dependent methyltransferase [Gemmatimonadales bacterium]